LRENVEVLVEIERVRSWGWTQARAQA